MAKCAKCLHRDVCKSCDSCCGSVPGCKQFIDREALAKEVGDLRAMLAALAERLTAGASPRPTERRGGR